MFNGQKGSFASFHMIWCKLQCRVASLKDFCAAATKIILTQCLLHRYKSKA